MFYQLGTHVFSSKDNIQKHAQAIMKSSRPEEPIQPPASQFLLDLLKRHPRSGKKIGIGVAAFFVRINHQWGQYKNMCFWLRRTDGTETDFSYRECIWPTDHKSEFIRACRSAIAPQIVAFRNRKRGELGSVAVCPITGKEFDPMTAQIDHTHPDTFEAIIERFIEEFQIDIPSVDIRSGHDGQLSDEFADEELKGRWTRFHALHAQLRMLPAKVNAQLGATPSQRLSGKR